MRLHTVAARKATSSQIILIDTRQHGCDRQGVTSVKAARMDARALWLSADAYIR